MSPLHFDAYGSRGAEILCIHGWACDGGQFAALARLLEDRHRIFCPDLPGHGKTPLGDFQPGFDRFADCVVSFAREQGLESPILLGHSMGGVLAMIAAGNASLKPRAVINLDGALPPAERTLAGQRVIRGWVDEPGFRERLAEALRQAFFLPQERDRRCDSIIRSMCAAPEAVLRFLPEQIDTLDADRILPRVTAPTLYIGAAEPRYDAGIAAVKISNFRLESIADAGHFLHVYAPDRVAALVGDFLGAVLRGGN
ncbi:MAG TPA: alpha/beta hydrolase [Chthoniobacterales bacterium]